MTRVGGDVRQEEVGELARRLARAEDNGLVLGRRVEYLAGELLEVPASSSSCHFSDPGLKTFSSFALSSLLVESRIARCLRVPCDDLNLLLEFGRCFHLNLLLGFSPKPLAGTSCWDSPKPVPGIWQVRSDANLALRRSDRGYRPLASS